MHLPCRQRFEPGSDSKRRSCPLSAGDPLKPQKEIKVSSPKVACPRTWSPISAFRYPRKEMKQVFQQERISRIITPPARRNIHARKRRDRTGRPRGQTGSGHCSGRRRRLLPGARTLPKKIFERGCSDRIPSGFNGLTEIVSSPAHATSVGLCLYAAQKSRSKKCIGNGAGRTDFLQ